MFTQPRASFSSKSAEQERWTREEISRAGEKGKGRTKETETERERERESEREGGRERGSDRGGRRRRGRRRRWGRGSIGLFSSACVDLPATGETIHGPPPRCSASHSHPRGCTRAGVMGEQWWWRAPSFCGYSTLPAFITPTVAPRHEAGCPALGPVLGDIL